MIFQKIISQFFPNDTEIQDFIIDNIRSLKVKKGDIISRNGSYNRNIYFVENGLLRAFYLENGKDITTNFYPEGKLVANIDTLFQEQPTRFNIEALENSSIVYCDYEKLEMLCKESLSAANFSRYILGNLMVQMSNRMTSLQYMTAKEKYENLMQDHKDIILRAPLGTIATYLGISPETLSRIRSSI